VGLTQYDFPNLSLYSDPPTSLCPFCPNCPCPLVKQLTDGLSSTICSKDRSKGSQWVELLGKTVHELKVEVGQASDVRRGPGYCCSSHALCTCCLAVLRRAFLSQIKSESDQTLCCRSASESVRKM
jgi:hypothetical protein